MNEVFWASWKEKERELRKNEPKCTCNGGRKHPDKCYHYPVCPYVKYWDFHFRKAWDSAKQRKTMQTIMETFLT